MAIYPGAVYRPLKLQYLSGAEITSYDRCDLHTQAGTGSLLGFFNKPKRASSHFWVSKKGLVEQYVDTRLQAEADYQGNPTTVSIETEGGTEPWTAAQLRAIIPLVSWIMRTHKMQMKLVSNSFANSDSSRGLGWHRIGIDGNFPSTGRYAGRLQRGGGMRYSSHFGKVCPGDARIDQIIDQVAPAVFGSEAPAPAPKPSTPKPSTAGKSIATLAQEVIDGKHGVGDARKRSLGAKYAAVQAEVNRRLLGKPKAPTAAKPKPAGKSITVLAREVLDGKHGNGEARRKSLGSKYAAVQGEVNRLLAGKPASSNISSPGKSISQMASEVIRGEHGNGHEARRKSLGVSAAVYRKVRAEVNRRV